MEIQTPAFRKQRSNSMLWQLISALFKQGLSVVHLNFHVFASNVLKVVLLKPVLFQKKKLPTPFKASKIDQQKIES